MGHPTSQWRQRCGDSSPVAQNDTSKNIRSTILLADSRGGSCELRFMHSGKGLFSKTLMPNPGLQSGDSLYGPHLLCLRFASDALRSDALRSDALTSDAPLTLSARCWTAA